MNMPGVGKKHQNRRLIVQGPLPRKHGSNFAIIDASKGLPILSQTKFLGVAPRSASNIVSTTNIRFLMGLSGSDEKLIEGEINIQLSKYFWRVWKL